MNGTLSHLIHDISFHPKKRMEIFLDLSHEQRAELLLHLTKHIQKDLAKRMADDELVATLEHLDPDEATDVVQLLPRGRREKIIDHLHSELQRGVQILSQFDARTAAGLMNIDYIQVQETDTVAEVAKQFKVHEKRTGRFPAIIAMRSGKIVGYMPVHKLGLGRPEDSAKKYVRRILTIRHNANHKEVLQLFRDHPHNKVCVIGERGNVVGIIYSDDVLRVLREQESASLYDFAGVHNEESVVDTARTKVKFRYKWLIVNLGTAFLAAFTVSLFEETIAKYVLLAVYMPIVAGMGGNAATQTLAVMVRGITLQQVDLRNSLIALRRELGAGFVNGLINGVIVFVVVYILNGNMRLGVVLGLAMVVNLLVAALFGTMVPLIMKRLGKDPATSATIFITTATDVLGFLVFLGLAVMLLG